MVLLDTSIWIDHLRQSNPEVVSLLENRHVLTHSFVLGELAMGTLAGRNALLSNLARLPRAIIATDIEVMTMVEKHKLFGLGIGWVDAHVLAGTLLTLGAKLWTKDKKLLAIAGDSRFSVAYRAATPSR